MEGNYQVYARFVAILSVPTHRLNGPKWLKMGQIAQLIIIIISQCGKKMKMCLLPQTPQKVASLSTLIKSLYMN